MQGFKHRRSQIFGWGPKPNHKSHAMTLSDIFERKTFCETKISQNGRSKSLNQEFAKGRELKSKAKLSKLGNVLSKLV